MNTILEALVNAGFTVNEVSAQEEAGFSANLSGTEKGFKRVSKSLGGTVSTSNKLYTEVSLTLSNVTYLLTFVNDTNTVTVRTDVTASNCNTDRTLTVQVAKLKDVRATLNAGKVVKLSAKSANKLGNTGIVNVCQILGCNHLVDDNGNTLFEKEAAVLMDGTLALKIKNASLLRIAPKIKNAALLRLIQKGMFGHIAPYLSRPVLTVLLGKKCSKAFFKKVNALTASL